MVSSPTQSAEVAIISKIVAPKTVTVDMMIDLFEDIESLVYLYFLIATIWTLLIINCRVLGSLRRQGTQRRNSQNVSKRLNFIEMSIKVSKSTWHILELLVNQENSTLSETFQNAMWLFYCIAYFVLMFGFVMNLMSTEQTVKINAKQIDSLDDLFYQDSSNDQIVAVLAKEFFLYDRLRNSRKDSKLDKLFHIMNKTASYSFVTMPTSKAVELNIANAIGMISLHIKLYCYKPRALADNQNCLYH